MSTVVAIADMSAGEGWIAAERMMQAGEKRTGQALKVLRQQNYLVGFVGTTAYTSFMVANLPARIDCINDMQVFSDFLRKEFFDGKRVGADQDPPYVTCEMIFLGKEGLWRLAANLELIKIIPFAYDNIAFCATGSGADFANGAIWMGLSIKGKSKPCFRDIATGAVQAACCFDLYSTGEIDCEYLKFYPKTFP